MRKTAAASPDDEERRRLRQPFTNGTKRVSTVARTPLPLRSIAILSDAMAVPPTKACEKALDNLVQLGKRAAPALPQIVSQLGKNSWRLTWKALYVLKTSGVAPTQPRKVAGEIVATIDTIATAPDEERDGMETALMDVTVAAGKAIRPHLPAVMSCVWLSEWQYASRFRLAARNQAVAQRIPYGIHTESAAIEERRDRSSGRQVRTVLCSVAGGTRAIKSGDGNILRGSAGAGRGGRGAPAG